MPQNGLQVRACPTIGLSTTGYTDGVSRARYHLHRGGVDEMLLVAWEVKQDPTLRREYVEGVRKYAAGYLREGRRRNSLTQEQTKIEDAAADATWRLQH